MLECARCSRLIKNALNNDFQAASQPKHN